MLSQNNVFLMLDGLDETDAQVRNSKLLPWLAELINHHPENRYVVTSRPVGYPPDWLKKLGFIECDLADFDAEQAREFTQHWNIARLLSEHKPIDEARRDGERAGDAMFASFNEHAQIRHLARTPLMLTAICLVNHYEGGTLPDDRAILYRLCVEGLLHNWDQRRGIESGFSLEEKLRACRELALKMQIESLAELPGPEVHAVFTRELGDAIKATALLESIRLRAGVLIERRPETFAFAHLTFQEYLAALAIHHGGDGALTPAELVNQCADPRWREVIPLYCGATTRNGAKWLLEELVTKPENDELSYLLCEAWGTASRELGRDSRLHDRLAKRVLELPQASVRTSVFDKQRFARLANDAIGRAGEKVTIAYQWLSDNAILIDWNTIVERLRELNFDRDRVGVSQIVHLCYWHLPWELVELLDDLEGILEKPGPDFGDGEKFPSQAEVAFVAILARTSYDPRGKPEVLPPDRLARIIGPILHKIERRSAVRILEGAEVFARAIVRSDNPPNLELLRALRTCITKCLKFVRHSRDSSRVVQAGSDAIKYVDTELAKLSIESPMDVPRNPANRKSPRKIERVPPGAKKIKRITKRSKGS
jgi:hypothetical protein